MGPEGGIWIVTNGPGKKPGFLIAGNWKMNGLRETGDALATALLALQSDDAPCELLVCPPFTLLDQVGGLIADSPIALGAQDCHVAVSGAHTGDVSAEMLADAGCTFVIVGHSERRTDHAENDELVRAKAEAAINAGLTPIICIGETLEQRDAGRAEEVVSAQLSGSLPAGATSDNTVIAYEPVWAIGTGRTPEIGDIETIHARIRDGLGTVAGRPDEIRILYGGSVKPGNAQEILGVANVNGALVGGASLNAQDFWDICASCP